MDSSFGLMLSKGSQPIEIVGATKGFVACLATAFEPPSLAKFTPCYGIPPTHWAAKKL